MVAQVSRKEGFSLDSATAGRLGLAERRLGQLSMLERLWPPWKDFARGPLTACSAMGEVRLRGKSLDIAELLALGAHPRPARPSRPLRWAVGLTQCRRLLEDEPPDSPLTPSVVSRVYNGLDAPQLARGYHPYDPPPSGLVDGAAVWTLAPRWIAAGLPPLWAAGLALASWEREGPNHARRSLAGRVLIAGLAPRLDLPPHAFDLLGLGMTRAAAHETGGLEGLIRRARTQGAWRGLVEVFLRAVELSAGKVVKTALAAQELYHGHQELIDTWVRAPRHPQRLLTLLLGRPVVDLPSVARELEVTQRTAGLLAKKLVDQGLLQETTGQRRGRRFAYKPLLQLLQPGWGEKPKSA